MTTLTRRGQGARQYRAQHTPPDSAWARRGACRDDADPNLWHPDTDSAPSDTALAKAICGMCPVIAECRRHALTQHEDWGIWGGLDAGQRRALLQHRMGAAQ